MTDILSAIVVNYYPWVNIYHCHYSKYHPNPNFEHSNQCNRNLHNDTHCTLWDAQYFVSRNPICIWIDQNLKFTLYKFHKLLLELIYASYGIHRKENRDHLNNHRFSRNVGEIFTRKNIMKLNRLIIQNQWKWKKRYYLAEESFQGKLQTFESRASHTLVCQSKHFAKLHRKSEYWKIASKLSKSHCLKRA